MVHILVLTGFASSVFSALVSYQQYGYSFLVGAVFGILIFLRISVYADHLFARAFLLLAFAVGVSSAVSVRASYLDTKYASGFAFDDKHRLSTVGVVEDYPNYKFSGNQYVAKISGTEARVLLQTQPYQRFGYLDTILVQASLDDVRKQKEWASYYRKLGVHYATFSPQLSAISVSSDAHARAGYTPVQRIRLVLFAAKMAIRAHVVEMFSSQASSLVLGMLLGERDELSKDEKDMFNRVGLSHILVVSGYNISLMISFVFIALKSVPKIAHIGFALAVVALFVLLVGYEPSVVRAALMGSIIIFAKVTHRPGSALNVLFLVAVIMICINPYGIFDAGLHLSFVATFSLLVMPDFKKVPEFVATTLWVFAFVAPYILYLSGAVSLAAIAANMAVAFLLSFFMLSSLVSIVLSFLHVRIGIDMLLVETMARYVFVVSGSASHVAPVILNTPPSLVTAGYVCVCAVVLFRTGRYSVREFIEKRYQRYVPQRPS